MRPESLINIDGVVKTRAEWDASKQKQEGDNGVIESEVIEKVIKKPRKKKATKKKTTK